MTVTDGGHNGPTTAGVKLGNVAPKVWNDLEQQGLSEQEMEEAAAEAAAAAAEEEERELRRLKAAELAREALNKAKEQDWKATADRNKKERELDEVRFVWADGVWVLLVSMAVSG